jgi:hypothetical protein
MDVFYLAMLNIYGVVSDRKLEKELAAKTATSRVGG